MLSSKIKVTPPLTGALFNSNRPWIRPVFGVGVAEGAIVVVETGVWVLVGWAVTVEPTAGVMVAAVVEDGLGVKVDVVA